MARLTSAAQRRILRIRRKFGEHRAGHSRAVCCGHRCPRNAGFSKSSGNPLSYLFGYRQSDGGFAHALGATSNIGATGQALMALVAYQAFTGGNSGTYEAVLTTGDWRDAFRSSG
ncbi:hypothetical protein LJK88_42545 [Paenibacillus sp. P26]|nr:hypothetical protein LJK88_42545 [Paenibacillus sp. P26]